MRLRSAALLLAAALAGSVLAGAPTPARAQGDTTAVAINTRDGMEIFRLAFRITRTMQEVVDQTNAAVAVSSCTECQTVAVSISAILIFSDPDVVTPTNLALALNVECESCSTLASAYQFVYTTGGPVRFTPEGSQRIAELRRSVLELLLSGASIEEIQAQLDPLMDEFERILETELVPAGSPTAEPEPSPSQDAPDTEPTSSPTTGDEPTPSPTATTEEGTPTPTVSV